MKNLLYTLGFLSLASLASCHRSDLSAFAGKWERDFFPAPNAPHHVEYQIYPDSIHYRITGKLVNVNYTLHPVYFNPKNRQIVAQMGEENLFVLFLKTQGDSICIFKEEVPTLSAGKDFPLPAPDNHQNHNQGWNWYRSHAERDF